MTRSPFSLARFLPAAALVACVATLAGAQDSSAPRAKKVLSVADYTKWRTIENAEISGDGRWVASVLRLTNLPTNDSKPELHLRNLDSGTEIVIPRAQNQIFSKDSRWIVYEIDSMPIRGGGRGGRGAGATDSAGAAPGGGVASAPQAPAPQAPAQGAGGRGGAGGAQQPLRRYELRELASGTTRAWKDVSSATFNAVSTHLILRRRPTEANGAAGGRGGGGGGLGGGMKRLSSAALAASASCDAVW